MANMSAPTEDGVRYEAGDIVAALYRALLKRSPDREGLELHERNLRQRGLEYVFDAFASSPEFRRGGGTAPSSLELNNSPDRMNVELRLTADEKARLWAHVRRVWTALGETEPYWSVLTDPKFRVAGMRETDALAAFYATGAGDVSYLDAFLRRNGVRTPGKTVVAEFGCGVGRVTGWLAKRFSRVVAFDVSASHLAAARERMHGDGAANVDFVHIEGPEGLKRLQDVDLFFSMIVLQHNPPPVMAEILDHACRGLKPGGIAFFQAPTYARDYAFDVKSYLEGDGQRNEMEMHVIPLSEVFRILSDNDMRVIDVRQDHCVGNFDRWISNTFLARKGG